MLIVLGMFITKVEFRNPLTALWATHFWQHLPGIQGRELVCKDFRQPVSLNLILQNNEMVLVYHGIKLIQFMIHKKMETLFSEGLKPSKETQIYVGMSKCITSVNLLKVFQKKQSHICNVLLNGQKIDFFFSQVLSLNFHGVSYDSVSWFCIWVKPKFYPINLRKSVM